MSTWTRFMDMYSGGGCKEPPYDKIYIEAPETEARVVFYNRFGHSADRVSCTCCGSDYSTAEGSLTHVTAYDRGCAYDNDTRQYVEQHCGASYRPYMSIAQYVLLPTVLLIRAEQIAPAERTGDVPEQGYVWRD